MRWLQRLPTALLGICLLSTQPTSKDSVFQRLFQDIRVDAAPEVPGWLDEAQPILDGLSTASQKDITAELPDILGGTSDPSLAVRRVAILALYVIATRSDGNTLIAGEE